MFINVVFNNNNLAVIWIMDYNNVSIDHFNLPVNDRVINKRLTG